MFDHFDWSDVQEFCTLVRLLTRPLGPVDLGGVPLQLTKETD